MNSNEKRWVVLLIAVVIIAVVLIIVLTGSRKMKEQIKEGVEQGQVVEESKEQYTEELLDGTKINTSKEFNSTKKYGNLEISNIQYTEKDGISVLLADVKNTGNTKHEEEIVKITILGEQGEEITELKAIIGNIETGKTIRLNASITADVTNAKDFKIEGIK